MQHDLVVFCGRNAIGIIINYYRNLLLKQKATKKYMYILNNEQNNMIVMYMWGQGDNIGLEMFCKELILLDL